MKIYLVKGEAQKGAREYINELGKYLYALKMNKAEPEKISQAYSRGARLLAEIFLAHLPRSHYQIAKDVSMNPRLFKRDNFYVISVEAENLADNRELHVFYF